MVLARFKRQNDMFIWSIYNVINNLKSNALLEGDIHMNWSTPRSFEMTGWLCSAFSYPKKSLDLEARFYEGSCCRAWKVEWCGYGLFWCDAAPLDLDVALEIDGQMMEDRGLPRKKSDAFHIKIAESDLMVKDVLS